MLASVELEPGDVGFTQYAIVTSKEIKAALDVVKGNIYGVDTNGYLVDLTAASGEITNASRGQVQAMGSSTPVSGEASGDRAVQCMVFKSRVILKAGVADLVPCQPISIMAAVTTTTPNSIMPLTSTGARFGVIYKIFGGKKKSIVDDKLFVDVFY